MPSSTAARVACRASSTRAFFSFIATSVAAPTLSPQRRRPVSQRAPAAFHGHSRKSPLDLHADLFDARFDISGIAPTVNDGGVLFRHFDALCLTQLIQRSFLKREACFLGNH